MTKQDLLDRLLLLPCDTHERPRNPRMRQLHRILSEQKVRDSDLPIFAAEIDAFAKHNETAERRKLAYFRYASGASQ